MKKLKLKMYIHCSHIQQIYEKEEAKIICVHDAGKETEKE